MIGINIDLTQPREHFSPLQLPSLAGWWDTSDNATLSGNSDGSDRGVGVGGTVAFIQDLSGNGRHLTASSPGTLGSDNFITLPSAAGGVYTCASFPYAYPLTAFVVMQNHASVGTHTIFGGNATSGQNLGFLIARTAATTGRVQALDYTNAGLPATRSLNYPAGSITSGGKSVLGIRVQAAQLANYNQALTETTTATVCLAGGTAVNINLGASTNTGTAQFANGKIAEAFICLAALTTAEATLAIQYLKNKWGVT